ncbi:uracil phosphoribosyltransferase [Namhaeicola litoreus]|uniref:Uracil phosphoribosyltransferase n=1 Tax=Namhaeicola litoreus TaxID=1052145 RepID=A0ABW3Y1N4_9FLAO
MKIHILDKTNSVLNNFIAELRNIEIQKDAMRFRRNIERVGEILSYEMSKHLSYSREEVETPLGIKEVLLPHDELVLGSILRAGLPLHLGVLNYFDRIENAFISAYRSHKSDGDFDIVVEYLAAPSLENKILILVDPMLATGKSLESVYEALKSHGVPKEVHLISVIGSKFGVDYIKDKFPENTNLWIATVDEDLNNRGYIVPGLGDAGDLAFGIKL